MVNGGGGPDTISGGTGEDELSGGAGDDTINARDGVRDVVNCGSGDDLARVDALDVVRGCEQVNRR